MLGAHDCEGPTKMPLVFLLNGPNLNLLGRRQPHIYGAETLADVVRDCTALAATLGLLLRCHQSNREYEIVDWVHAARDAAAAIVINPAAFSHTSVAVLDALNTFDGAVIEVHISNIHKLFLFRVDRDHRFAIGQRLSHALVEMHELGVAVRVAFAFARLAIGLQAEFLPVQQFTDRGAPDLVTHGHQCERQLRQALAGPAQRRHRIAARVRLHHRQQIGQKGWVLVHERLVAPARAADTRGSELIRRRQFSQAPSDRTRGDPGCLRHRGNPAIPSGAGFRRGEDTSPSLVQVCRKSQKALTNRGDINHRSGVAMPTAPRESARASKSQRDSVIFGWALRPDDGSDWLVGGEVWPGDNPRLAIALEWQDFVRLWAACRSENGIAHWPDAGGLNDQAAWVVDGFAVLSSLSERWTQASRARADV